MVPVTGPIEDIGNWGRGRGRGRGRGGGRGGGPKTKVSKVRPLALSADPGVRYRGGGGGGRKKKRWAR